MAFSSLSPANIRWGCGFTYVAMIFAVLYSIFVVVSLVYLVRLFSTQPFNKRRPQKIFLILLVLQSVLRALYFVLWPQLNASAERPCTPTADDGDQDNA